MGSADIYIDNKLVSTADWYSPSLVSIADGNTSIYQSGELSVGEHTVIVKNAGNKNPVSTGNKISLDKVVVSNELPPPPHLQLDFPPNGPAKLNVSLNSDWKRFRYSLKLDWSGATNDKAVVPH